MISRTASLALPSWPHRVTKLLALALLLLLSVTYLNPLLIRAGVALGGFYSEKMVGSGTASSQLVGPAGSGLTVVGGGPALTTNPVGSATLSGGVTSAVLRGTLTSLNGFPQAERYFIWGYSPSALTNVTPVVITTVTGAYQATITGWDPAETVYYRAAGGADGPTRGGVISFQVAGGQGVAYWILWYMVPLAAAMAALFIALRMGANWFAIILAVLAYIAVHVMVRSILPTLW